MPTSGAAAHADRAAAGEACALKISPVKIAVETRKKGKVVTALRGLTGREAEVSELLSHLKSVCGAGGTFKDGVLEIQGEHADRVRDALLKRGYRVQAK